MLTAAACSGDPQPGRTQTASVSPTAPATTSAASSAPATTTTDAPLTVSDAAQARLDTDTIAIVWPSFRTWLLTATFDADLISTGTPTPAQLSNVTARLAPQAAADLNADVAKKDTVSIQAIETLVAVGAMSPGHTLLPADAAVTGRLVTAATADVDTNGDLVLTVDSRALLHYAADSDPTQRASSTFTRHVAYTLTLDSTRWTITSWQGTYDTSPLTNE